MTTNKVDIAMDKFTAIQEIYQMSTEELDDFQDRLDIRLFWFYIATQETEADQKLEMMSDSDMEVKWADFDGEDVYLHN